MWPNNYHMRQLWLRPEQTPRPESLVVPGTLGARFAVHDLPSLADPFSMWERSEGSEVSQYSKKKKPFDPLQLSAVDSDLIRSRLCCLHQTPFSGLPRSCHPSQMVVPCPSRRYQQPKWKRMSSQMNPLLRVLPSTPQSQLPGLVRLPPATCQSTVETPRTNPVIPAMSRRTKSISS